MRWSQSFIPTLRDDPADAEAISHKLLVRGGFIRQLMTGVYSLLPLGMRVRSATSPRPPVPPAPSRSTRSHQP